MTDLALKRFSLDGNLRPSFDITIAEGDLARDDGLETAVILSLFLDRRANADDALPTGETDRRGWWADAYQDADRHTGSRLWLLRRETTTPQVVQRFREYCLEALNWMVKQGVARSVNVTATRYDNHTVRVSIEIRRASGDSWSASWAVALGEAAT